MSWRKWFGIAEPVQEVSKQEKKKEEIVVPEVELKGICQDPTKGIKIDLDWNDQFIAYLKANGFSGNNDEHVIQKWLSHLALEVADDLEEVSGERNVRKYE